MTFPNAALTDICRQLMDEWGLSIEEISNLAKNIPGECKAIADNRAEAAWMDRQSRLMESGGPDDSAYRRSIVDAGRGHLLRG